MRKREKKTFTAEELLKRYKKRYRIVSCILAAFVALTALYLYLNYDYLAFKHFITSSYIYTETLDAIYGKYLGEDLRGGYFSNFDNVVIAVTTERIRAEKGDKYTYLYTPSSLQKTRQYEKQEAAQSAISILDDRTVYLRLTNFTKYTLEFMEKNIDKLKSRPNIIIDLQGNRGGDIDVMVNISSMFLPKGRIVATDHFRWFDHVYRSNRDQPLKYDKIIILQNGDTASSSENMIAALNDNLDNVELIGTETFGKGIGQFTLPLRRGYAVKATILQWFTPAGVNIQGDGIDPDIEYTDDDIIEFALSRFQWGPGIQR
ncbi:MAG TPA: S41 family peptidase [Clostridiales bacterium]|nr:S41 family peptidase [Clostridiales bacterium]